MHLSPKIQQRFLSLYEQSLERHKARQFSAFRQLINLANSHRSDDLTIRKFAECIGWIWLERYEENQLYQNERERHFPEKSLAQFATILAENGKRSEAIEICEKAISWNLSDGTKGGFSSRKQRIEAGKPQTVVNLDINTSNCKRYVKDFMDRLRNLYEIAVETTNVPDIDAYWAQIQSGELSANQKDFYDTWCKTWQQGQYLSTHGQEAYVMIYIKENLAISKKSISYSNIEELLQLRDSVEQIEPGNNTVIYFCGRFAADSLIYLEEYSRACDIFPQMPLNDFLSLRYASGQVLTGSDLIRAFGISCLTEFGKDKIQLVIEETGGVLYDYQKERGTDLLSYWISRVEPAEFRIFRSIGYYPLKKPAEFRFQESEILDDFKSEVAEILRKSENLVRENMGIARIGEGWISETELYYHIKQSFPQFEVLHHASPEWLGRQHLDIYLPEISLAIEYQGRQHYEPVDFFGGKEGLEATQARDARKRKLCDDNGITLIEVEPDYDFQELEEQIATIAR